MFSKIRQFCFVFLIIVNLTNLFVFSASWLGFSLTIVGSLILICLAIYVVSEWNILNQIIRHPIIVVCSVLFVVWPIIYAIFPISQGYSVTREIVLQIYYILLLYGTIIFVIRNGTLAGRRVVLICFSITLFGIVAETFFPSFFYGIAIPDEEGQGFASSGRAAGFFINPNNAGRFIVLMYLLLMLSPRKILLLEILFFSMVTFGAVLLTASRSSVMIAMFAVIGVIGLRYAISWVDGRRVFKPERLFFTGFGVTFLGGILLSIFVVGGTFLLKSSGLGDKAKTADRLRFFTGGLSGFVEAVEEEAHGRYYTVEPYIQEFKENWLFGKGLIGYRAYRKENNIELTPHNTIFALWMDYGVAYIMAIVATCIYFLVNQGTRRAECYLGLSFSYIFVACVIAIMFTFDSLMNQRPTYVVLGFLLACCVAPDNWFQYDLQKSLRIPTRIETAKKYLIAREHS